MCKYTIGILSEFFPWVRGVKAQTTTVLFTVIPKFRKQPIYRQLTVSAGNKGMGYHDPAKIYYHNFKALYS